MPLFAQFIAVVSKFAVVLAINLSLFMLIPVGNSVFKGFQQQDTRKVESRRVLAELVKPREKKPEKTTKSRIRTVKAAGAEEVRNPMKFKFTPDLGVEGDEGGVAIASQDLEVEVFEEGETDEPVVQVYTPRPAYPSRAVEMAVEGRVEVTFVVGVDGRVSSIESINSPHPSFDAEVRKTLFQWKFRPAKNKGVPVKQRVRIPFDFFLDA